MTRGQHPEFSPDGYLGILTFAQEKGYRLCRIDEAAASEERTMILRHDIDFSVDLAFEMARLEADIGARATYFFMTTSEYYNVFSEPYREILRQIVSLGHEVGLHWDSRALPSNPAQHPEFLRSQLILLSAASGSPVRSASQHIPTDTPAFDIGPYVENNAYSKRFNTRFAYVSDSSMAWREITPLDLIDAGKDIQFLSHPIWWMSEGSIQDDKILSFSRSLSAKIQDYSREYLVYMKKILNDRQLYDNKFLNNIEKIAGDGRGN